VGEFPRRFLAGSETVIMGAGLMNDYWDELSQKELYMLATEWDFNTALEVREEEGV